MVFRPFEPRSGLGLTAIAVGLTVMLFVRRGGAFRPVVGRNRSAATAATAAGGSVVGRHTGPEGTKLPDVMHRTISADGLKVGFCMYVPVHHGLFTF